MKNVIAFNGAKESGKSFLSTELAYLLTNTHNMPARVVSFATPLKLLVNGACHLNNVMVRDDYIRRWAETFELDENTTDRLLVFIHDKFATLSEPDAKGKLRIALQIIGTEFFRDTVDVNFWTKIMRHKIRESRAQVVIIDDMRFENEEALVLKYEAGQTVGVLGGVLGDGHRSETSLHPKDCHTVFDNSAKDKFVAIPFVKQLAMSTARLTNLKKMV